MRCCAEFHGLPPAGQGKGGKVMEHAALEREALFMTIEGGKSADQITTGRLYTVADIEGLPEGERAEP